MNQLIIEELSAYLPYGVQVSYGRTPFELTIHNFTNVYRYITKIHLRPLSQLTTEIEVNGEKFVPIEKLEEMYGITIDKSEFLPINLEPYNIVRQLHRWHFDTFNLLKRGLSEPIL